MTDATAYPEHWPAVVRDAYESVIAQRPELAGAEFAALETACELLAAGEAHAVVAREAGGVATGSTGQIVVHPSSIESRLNRTAAAGILARLALPPTNGKLTASERGRQGAAARWQGRT
ncbi:hypothetical protein GRS96_12205 [Rathayibacter sp. VKM Ac-2803]|uniref:hypothetical protein n=1 Tax=Rathayibacter sp. VKM Ac-2803 TaxID=2609256 RepID=UPI00135B6A14|nr:hypothetical protein [Rathayibacter sp. VKM Ac-2803]MWV50032.1 hypothetical protein [Rathayibacter sp. VKM Ac-2803]